MSCEYVLENNLEGDFVECGVWRGGNSIIATGIFKLYNSNKKVYLYDTFQGMTLPQILILKYLKGIGRKNNLKPIGYMRLLTM
jgi:hypothetical protein